MANQLTVESLWQRKSSGKLAGLIQKLKREEWLVHTTKPNYSICIKHPLTILPELVSSSNDYKITTYQDGKPPESVTVPEGSINYMLIDIGKNIM